MCSNFKLISDDKAVLSDRLVIKTFSVNYDYKST